MSTLPVLVSALAQVDGRDRATVEYFGRTIREAGYITTGKRGMGAPKMTVREAANLLIGLNGADGPKEAPIAIDRFRSLRQTFVGDGKLMKERLAQYDDAPQPIKDVMDVHTFGEALDALIEGIPDLMLSFWAYYQDAYHDQSNELFMEFIQLRVFGVLIVFERYAAKIEMFHMIGSKRVVDFSTDFMVDTARLAEGFYGRRGADRKVSVSIGFPTLIAAWKGLNPDSEIAGKAGGDPS